jgi:hypothetical protein
VLLSPSAKSLIEAPKAPFRTRPDGVKPTPPLPA